MKYNKIMLALVALSVSGGAMAHGYIMEPESRNYLCQKGVNDGNKCGPVRYEPQSVEGFDGFPAAGPKDKELPGVSSSRWSQLNTQRFDYWAKNKIKAGPNDFTWKFTASHPIKDFKYYITKPGWNPNAELTRDSFDLTPFCVIEGGPAIPGGTTHTCNVPERSGYHIIYGAWDVSDTDKTFYNTIDVEFDNDAEEIVSEWTQRIGSISPQQDLPIGSSVKSRVFDANGERTDLNSEITINSAEEGKQDNWAFALANAINTSQQALRAGSKDNAGQVNAVYGVNAVYTKANSGLTRVEIQQTLPEPEAGDRFNISGLKDNYTIAEGSVTLHLDSTAQGRPQALDLKVFDANQKFIATATAVLDNSAKHMPMKLNNVTAGKYTLVAISHVKDGETLQQSFEFTLLDETSSDNYEFSFPNGLGEYKAGTLVQHPKTGKVYECKPFPYSGWCNSWSISATHYEPGVGSNWQDAWIEK
ncbi:GlcNAc-binding protein A precursor [Serratia quinivorans]|uniref:N-acetylglucosamine-binding protein GbpA n=1 Tax=Serratia quinivorans TaxID=137545 RepID=UPI00217B4AF1|nr:N-acetylglucosamine-binding protein GbpA [Serratia quinivorans]CAI1902587.1 GlcNAc-binding protein A precursor [Serratia quinivorans]